MVRGGNAVVALVRKGPARWWVPVVALALLLAWSAAPAHAAERCGGPAVAGGAPPVVFVVLDGNHSAETETGRAYPLPVARPVRGIPVVSNYCPVTASGAVRRFPPGLDAGLRRMAISDSAVCRSPGGLRTDSCLLARLADAGAVVLPFSYAGSALESTPAGAVFSFTGYDNPDSIQPPEVSVARLEAMVASIERAWPATAIVGAHSNGGMIAEAMWEQRAAAGRLGNLVRVYTWDSPINGIANCLLGGALLGDLLGEKIGSSRAVAAEWCRRWGDRDARNARIIELSRDGSFVAAGAPNDATYANGPLSGGGELRPQLVYRCPDDGSRADSPCIASPPSLVGPTPTCDAAGPGLFGVSGHDLVRVCPPIVRHQLAAVVSATNDRMVATPACGAAPKRRPATLALDCSADGAAVRDLRWSSWAFAGAVGTGVLECRRAPRTRCAYRTPRRVRVELSAPQPCAHARRFAYGTVRVPRVRTSRRHRTVLVGALGCTRR